MPTKAELELLLIELHAAANAITGVANVLREQFITAEPAAPSETVPETSKPVDVTLEEVRAVLTEISRAGKTEAVRALIKKHGANKLTEIEPGKYGAVLADARALANG